MAKKISAEAIDDGKLESIKQQIAYKMWEEEGRPEGRSEAHWLAACDVVEEMLTNTAELPAWFKRKEQAAAPKPDAIEPETATRFQDVARRFARGT